MKLHVRMNRFVILLVVLSFLLPSVAADNTVRENTYVINEYQYVSELSLLGHDTLKEMGYAESEIEDIMSYKEGFKTHVLMLNKTYTDDELLSFGYTDDDIRLIRNYDGTYRSDAQLAANLTIRQWIGSGSERFMYNSTSNKTTATVYFDFTWTRIPYWTFEDKLVFVWSDGYRYNATNCTLNYLPYVSNWPRNASPTTLSDLGCFYYSLPMRGLTDSHILNNGSGSVQLWNNGQYPDLVLNMYYGHKLLSPSSISLNFNLLGPSVSFSPSYAIDYINVYKVYS